MYAPFFVSTVPFYGGAVRGTFGCAGDLFGRSVNPHGSAASSIDSVWRRLRNRNKEDHAMTATILNYPAPATRAAGPFQYNEVTGLYDARASLSAAQIIATARELLHAEPAREAPLVTAEERAMRARIELAGMAADTLAVLGLGADDRVVSTAHFRLKPNAWTVPADAVRGLLQHNATACLVARSHAGAWSEPDNIDRTITYRLSETFDLIGLCLRDYLVVSDNTVHSYRSLGYSVWGY